MSALEYIKFIDYNYIRGYEYEKYVVGMMHKYYDIEEIYLWKDVPYRLFVDASIIFDDKYKRYIPNNQNARFRFLMDTGIDIIAKLKNKDILLIQCKCYRHRCISQKNLGGFYRILLDTFMYNKNNKKKTNVIGLIVHNTYLSDIITSSYCYKHDIVKDVYIPFETETVSQMCIQNKLKHYKDIVFIINIILIIINSICLYIILSKK